ncbi:tyrosine-type recombinase/integrase [Wukongibacter baidiensis]|uniref:tyrosine-type recombinase/integrase n=1 Tax=Wukongibacter baidiensis TaxID=1723361 RepID=UPI003D7FA4A0
MRGHIAKKGTRYYPVIYLGRDEEGKRKYKWFSSFKRKKDAEKELTKIVAQYNNDGYIGLENITLKEYMENWQKNYVEENLKPKTIASHKVCINRIIVQLGQVKLQKLQPIHIQNLYTYLLKEGRQDGNGGLSAKSVIQTHRVLRKALHQAVKLQLLNRNPADYVDPPRAKKYDAQVLNEKEIQEYIEAYKDTDIYIPFLLGITLGLRRGEALGLRWCDIDFKSKTITIRQTLLYVDRNNIFSTPKSDKSRRTIVITENLLNILKKKKAEQDLYRSLLGGYDDNDLVCCQYDGSIMTPNSFSSKFKYIQEKKKLKKVRFHDLRHTNATLMLKNNVPAKVASERLGHSTIGITLDLYSHVMREMQEETAEKLEDLILKNSTNI